MESPIDSFDHHLIGLIFSFVFVYAENASLNTYIFKILDYEIANQLCLKSKKKKIFRNTQLAGLRRRIKKIRKFSLPAMNATRYMRKVRR